MRSVQDSVLHVPLLGLKVHGPYPPVRGSRAFEPARSRAGEPNAARKKGLGFASRGEAQGTRKTCSPLTFWVWNLLDFTVSLWDFSLHFGPGNFEADVHRRHRP